MKAVSNIFRLQTLRLSQLSLQVPAFYAAGPQLVTGNV